MEYRALLGKARRVVVKVGTSTLTHPTGKLNYLRIERLVRELADLANAGREMILVTSGAVAAGMDRMGLAERPKTIPEKQAAAAVGQGILMHVYEKFFADYGQVVAQVLLTRDDTVDRKRYLNARNTLETLLRRKVIPIINENDVVAVDELKIGDNDNLSALVAGLVDADVLIILSDVEGVYTANPQKDPGARLIPLIEDITPDIENLSAEPGSLRGTGGMFTKIQAGKVAVNSGVMMVIASGGRDGVIRDILRGQPIGTLFCPKETRPHVRKRWIAFGAVIQGTITVDAGAEHAIVHEGGSLLPSGVVAASGGFEVGNTVSVINQSGREIARGIVNYSAEEVARIKGLHTNAIAGELGYRTFDEVIHRDNLVLLV